MDKEKTLLSRFWLLFACQAVLASGMALSFPFFAIYLHRDRGIPMSLVGPCLALSVMVTALSQGLGGELSDVWGRKRVMLASLIARSVFVSTMAYAVWRTWSFPALVILHILTNFVGNFFDPSARGWIADHFDPSRRNQIYGFLRMAVNVGWALGPAVGGMLAQGWYAALFTITAALCVVCAGLVLVFIQESLPRLRARSFSWQALLTARRDRRFLRLCACDLLIALVIAQFVVSLSVHCTQFVGLTERQVGLLYSLNGIMVVALQYPLGAWWSRWKLSAALSIGAALYAAGYAGVGLAGGIGTMAISVAVVTLGEIIVNPGLHTLAANMAPENLKGRYLGALGVVHQFGSSLGPLVGGLGLNYISPEWTPGPWVLIAGAAAAASAGFLSLGKILTPTEEGLGEWEIELREREPIFQ